MFLFAMATNCQEVVTQQTEKKKKSSGMNK